MKKGKINKIQMHTRITYKGFDNDEVLDSMLLYICKCVAVVEAHEVFGKLQSSDIVSWTILISGDGLHGYNDNALDIFDEMIVDNVSFKFCHTCKHPKLLHHLENLAKRPKITQGDCRRGTPYF